MSFIVKDVNVKDIHLRKNNTVNDLNLGILERLTKLEHAKLCGMRILMCPGHQTYDAPKLSY